MTPSAVLVLGWSGLRALLRRPFRARGALRRVLARGVAERIAPLAADDIAAVREASRCLACGRCDAAAGTAWVPADWVLAELRDLTDCDLAQDAPAADVLPERLESVCPAGVSFARLAASARAMAARVAVSQAHRC